MQGFSVVTLLSLSCLVIFSIPLQHVHSQQLPPAIRITWAPSSTMVSTGEATTAFNSIMIDSSVTSISSSQATSGPTPLLWEPSVPIPSELLSVSTATRTKTISEVLTSTVYENTETITVTAAPMTVTDTITISDPFTATPGSFWSAPAQFSDLDSFKIAHFACGEHNLRITKGVPPDAFDESLAIALPAIDEDMEALYSSHFSNASSALQLFYPENSINPANWPQGGADFYATPLPLADASNVTLEYSVFFPKGFDWVQGGKLPGLYGGHMTCSGGDDASLCFSTRLMWRAGGAGELYLYAPKDKQTYALCHAPPESVCNAEYGLSVGRGSFKFSPGAWTNVRQTVTLNTPGKQDGTFRLEVNGKTVMDRHDVYYRDEPLSPTSSPSTVPTSTSDGGLLSPLLGGVLKAIDGAGVNKGILPPVGNEFNSSSTPGVNNTAADPPSIFPFQHPFSNSPATSDAALALGYNSTSSPLATTKALQLSATQETSQPPVTITNYVWAHAFTGVGKEESESGIDDDSPKPIAFSGLFFSTFFGGNSKDYATPKDQYTWFKDFSITINA